jgi:predicted Zn finger-like uncharacterized protein
MIIRCRKCETRFRFDETLIGGDGVWVRCSRCQNVFFQERPSGEFPPAGPAAVHEVPTVRISDAKRMPDDRFPQTEERLSREDRAETGVSPVRISGQEAGGEDERERAAVPDRIEEDLGQVPLRDAEPEDEQEEALPEDDDFSETERKPKRWGRMILKVVALMMVTVLVVGGVTLWLLPEVRTQALEWVSPWLRAIPGSEKFLGTEDAKKREIAAAPIRIKDLRQRSVANLLSGNLRVLEGVAVNQSPTPLARIRVRLVISDAYDVVLGEKNVYAGNLLTDVELSTLADPEIQRELSIPQGSDVANERVPPNGEIPFMIVFGQEQSGAVKTVVLPAGADRVP